MLIEWLSIIDRNFWLIANFWIELQQLERLEANKVERATKMELAHSNKTRSIQREKLEIEKEKAALEKKLEGEEGMKGNLSLCFFFKYN